MMKDKISQLRRLHTQIHVIMKRMVKDGNYPPEFVSSTRRKYDADLHEYEMALRILNMNLE
jgi:hypothetical protein